MSNDNYSLKPFELYNDKPTVSGESGLNDSGKRRIAVETALDLIRAQLLSGKGDVSSLLLNLGEHADNIQKALKAKTS